MAFTSNPVNNPDIISLASIPRQIVGMNMITNNQSRIGNKVTLTSVSISGYFVNTRLTLSSVNYEPDMMRFAIIVWKGNSPPTWYDVWDNGTTAGSAMSTTQNLFSPYNHENISRIKVLYDKVMIFTPQEIENSGWKRTIKKKFKMHYNQTYASDAGNTGNGPFVIAFAWSNYNINSPVYYNFVSRARFTDL